MPLDLPHRNVFVSYNFEANYNLPENWDLPPYAVSINLSLYLYLFKLILTGIVVCLNVSECVRNNFLFYSPRLRKCFKRERGLAINKTLIMLLIFGYTNSNVNNCLDLLFGRFTSVSLVWIPGHHNIPGNCKDERTRLSWRSACRIHTHIIGLYNLSVSIIDLLSLYICGGSYSLMSTPNSRFFEKLYMAVLFTCRVLPQIC